MGSPTPAPPPPEGSLRSRLGAGYIGWLVRLVAAAICFVVGIVLSVLPGPAILFFALGFVLLGVSIGQFLLTVHAVQDWLHRHVPPARRLPRLRKGHIRAILRQRWVRAIDRLSAHRDRRRRARERRRRARERLRRRHAALDGPAESARATEPPCDSDSPTRLRS